MSKLKYKKKNINKQSQITPYILVLVGFLLLTGGFIFFEIILKEKNEKKAIEEIVNTEVSTEQTSRGFFIADLYSCIDELVKEAAEKAFREKLKEKALSFINSLPVVFDGVNKVNLKFEDLRDFVEKYVEENFYICKNTIYDYKESKGVYVIPNLDKFEIYESGWVAKIRYKIYDLMEGTSFEDEKEITGESAFLIDFLELYNKIVNYEYSTRAMESNLFTFIYHPYLYSFYYGYPTTNIILPCNEMRFDLEDVRKQVKDILEALISRYRVKNTENSLDVEEIFKLPLLEDFRIGVKVWFYLLKDNTTVDFSVVEGSNAYIRNNELVVRPDQTAVLSPNQNSVLCSYDLFYDIVAPVVVNLDYEGKKLSFIMVLKINNNVPSNRSTKEMKVDNRVNYEFTLEAVNQCEFNGELLKASPTIKTLFKGNPVDAIIKIEGDPCSYETKNGEAKVPISCIGCSVYAVKENYISDSVIYYGERELTLSLYKTKNIMIWTIYTPEWLVNNWGNSSFKDLKIQGVSSIETVDENDPIETIKLVAKKNLPQFDEIIAPILINNGVSLFYSKEINLENLTYSTNGFRVVEGIPYEFYVSQNNEFIKKGEITFSSDNYFYDETEKKLYPCEVKLFEFKDEIELGKEVILIRLSNDKVLIFPYYTRVYNIEQGRTFLTTKYLMFCIPSHVRVKDALIYEYDENQNTWVKVGSYSFFNNFKLIVTY